MVTAAAVFLLSFLITECSFPSLISWAPVRAEVGVTLKAPAPAHPSAWNGNAEKFAPDLFEWHHCGRDVESDDLVVEISDDGQGFDPEATPGVGLSSMRERAAKVDGRLEIESEVGLGTSVRLLMPVQQKG